MSLELVVNRNVRVRHFEFAEPLLIDRIRKCGARTFQTGGRPGKRLTGAGREDEESSNGELAPLRLHHGIIRPTGVEWEQGARHPAPRPDALQFAWRNLWKYLAIQNWE